MFPLKSIKSSETVEIRHHLFLDQTNNWAACASSIYIVCFFLYFSISVRCLSTKQSTSSYIKEHKKDILFTFVCTLFAYFALLPTHTFSGNSWTFSAFVPFHLQKQNSAKEDNKIHCFCVMLFLGQPTSDTIETKLQLQENCEFRFVVFIRQNCHFFCLPNKIVHRKASFSLGNNDCFWTMRHKETHRNVIYRRFFSFHLQIDLHLHTFQTFSLPNSMASLSFLQNWGF